MEIPRHGADHNFRGARTPSGPRPALLPRPNPSQVNSSRFSLPPPIRMNNYSQMTSAISQPPLPNFNTSPLSITPNSRTNNASQLPGGMVPIFSQPPPIRYPPPQYSGQLPPSSNQNYLIPPGAGGSFNPNITNRLPPPSSRNFSGYNVPIPQYPPSVALNGPIPKPSPNANLNFHNLPPPIRPQSSSQIAEIPNTYHRNNSDERAISRQSRDLSNQTTSSGAQRMESNRNVDNVNSTLNRSSQYHSTSQNSRADTANSHDGGRGGYSYDRSKRGENYRGENHQGDNKYSDKYRRNESYDRDPAPYNRNQSRERYTNSMDRHSRSNSGNQGEECRKSSALSTSKTTARPDDREGSFRKRPLNSPYGINKSKSRSPSQKYDEGIPTSYKGDTRRDDITSGTSDTNRKHVSEFYQPQLRSHSQANSQQDKRQPEAKRQRLDDPHQRRTPSLENENSRNYGKVRRSRSSSIGKSEQHRRSLSPERRPSRRRQPVNTVNSQSVGSSYEGVQKPDDIEEQKINEYLKLTPDEIIDQEKKIWTRSSPADLYYERDMNNPVVLKATPRLQKLLDRFEEELIHRGENARSKFPDYKPYKLSVRDVAAKCRSGKGCCGGPTEKSDSEDDEIDDVCEESGDDSNDDDKEEQQKLSEISSKGKDAQKKNQVAGKRSNCDKKPKNDHSKGKIKNELLDFMKNRQEQPYRLDHELWDNQPGELNDGPACRCSKKSRQFGIRHGIYQGENTNSDRMPLDPMSNNGHRLYHYRVTISPPTNFLVKTPTVIPHDGHDFIFEGFSLFTTQPLKTSELPVCNIVRFSIKYSVLYFQEKMPDNITVRELELFHRYFFNELLELYDFDLGSNSHQFLFMPRFVRDLSENGKEILSMNEVMSYLIKSGSKKLMDEMDLLGMTKMPAREWQDNVVEKIRGQLVTYPGMRPSTLRVDQLDKEQDNPDTIQYPQVVHFGSSPPQLCYAGNGDYMKAWRDCVKFRHLLANMPKVKDADRQKLADMEEKLNEIRSNIKTKRVVVVAISAQNFFKTGLMTDIVQHGLLLPSLVTHLRFHASLDYFENEIQYKFKNRHLLQLAMTHPSYKENFGTNPDHARNALSHCGIRQPEFGDKKVHTAGTRKRGINMLISIMSKFGKQKETESKVGHNERLEFLGDAVVEFITSVHLFHMFPDLEEGGLATYRAALVQNQHLAILAERLGLEKYMLYAHGNDLCHDAELRHAMANCFEALMGAIYLDSGINEADKVFAHALFGQANEDDTALHETWTTIPLHPLQAQEPKGDRHWISSYDLLQKLVTFENSTGVEFTHIRLLARSFSDRSLSNCYLTMGSNQRLEFLGDTVLQLVTSDYLYRHFPEHHEGHLSLLRSSMVNNRTQAIVCDDLGIPNYAMFSNPRKELKMKDRADLLEALIGAIYVDKDLDYCRTFAEVCFFPRLFQFIINQDWNDPKSKLQQCCLTLRTMDSGEPDIPIYKVIACKGPTNTRVYTVAVYFRGQRLAHADGPSIQAAEMNAAKFALQENSHLFPHLQHQKRIMERSFMNQGIVMKKLVWEEEVRNKRRQMGLDVIHDECSKRNDEKIRKALEKRQSEKTVKDEEITEAPKEDNGHESQKISTIEPEPEKSYKREELDIELNTTESSMINTKRDESDTYNKSSKFDPTSSTGMPETFAPEQHRYKGKRTFEGGQIKNQYSFKNQHEGYNEIIKTQYNRPTINIRLSHNQPRNLPSKGNGNYGTTNSMYSDRNQINDTSPISKGNHPELNTKTATELNTQEQKECHNEEKLIPSNIPGENNLRSGDGNKEEGELTDDDSETSINKRNIESFDDYAEPISSPE